MTQPAVIPALLELCCLLLSLPGVMRETDLAKSPAAARCEMDSGTALGRQSQARHLLGPLQTQHIPCAPQPRGAQLSQLPSLSHPLPGSCQHSHGSSGSWALRFCPDQRTFHCCTASPQHFLRLILPRLCQTGQEHPACPSPLLSYNKPATGQGSLSSTPVRAQGTCSKPISTQTQGQGLVSSFRVFSCLCPLPHVQQPGFGGQWRCQQERGQNLVSSLGLSGQLPKPPAHGCPLKGEGQTDRGWI